MYPPKPQAESKPCELCGRFEGQMEDPTWDKRNTPAPFWICDVCAKEKLDAEMFRLQMEVIH